MIEENTNVFLPTQEDTNGMLAGAASLVNGENGVGEVHDVVLAEVDEYSFSPTVAGIETALGEEAVEDYFNSVYATGNKDTIAQGVLAYQENPSIVKQPSLNKVIAQDTAQALPAATEQQANEKSVVLGALEKYTEYANAKQAMMSEWEEGADIQAEKMVTDFGAMLLPMYENVMQMGLIEDLGLEGVNSAQALYALGSNKEAAIEAYYNMPLEERKTFDESFAEVTRRASTVGGYTNEMYMNMTFDQFMNRNYDKADKVFDNVVGWLDVIGVGGLVGTGVNKMKSFAKARKASRLAEFQQPVSPIQTVQKVDKAKTGELYAEVAKDTSDNAAQALTGTRRDQALAEAELPVPAREDGSVADKLHDPLKTYEKAIVENSDLVEIKDNATLLASTKKEIEAARAKHLNDFTNTEGVVARQGMVQIKDTDKGFNVTAMYSAAGDAWRTPQEAIDMARISLKDRGVRDSDLVPYFKDETGDFVPYTGQPLTGGEEFAVSMNYESRLNLDDITSWTDMVTTKNFLDQNALLSKLEISENVLSPASRLDQHITKTTTAAADKESRARTLLQNKASEFTIRRGKLPEQERLAIDRYLEEADEKGLGFDRVALKNEYNFSDAAIDAIEKHREFFDLDWAMSNRIAVDGMRSKGFKIIDDAGTGTRLHGKPIKADDVDLNNLVYDVEADKMRYVTREELAKLYDEQGGIMQMRRPMQEGDDATDLVLFKKEQTPRTLRDDDFVIPYRKGYGGRRTYEADNFIVEIITLKDGRKIRKALSTAETTKDANTILKRYQDAALKRGEKKVYEVHGNVKDRDTWQGYERDLLRSRGQSAQRTRGKQLEDGSASLHGNDSNHLVGPIESISNSIGRLANKIAWDDHMNVMKERFNQQYKDVLKNKQFPNTLDDIGSLDKAKGKMVADARSNFKYLQMLENGTINYLDDTIKAVFRTLSDALDMKGWDRASKLARGASEVSPTQFGKSISFNLFIVFHIGRQLVLNSMQSLALVAEFTPSMKFRTIRDTSAMMNLKMGGSLKNAAKLSGRTESEMQLLYNQWKKTGMEDAIDANSIVRGMIQDSAKDSLRGARTSYTDKAAGVARGIQTGARKIGFDAGEYIQKMTAWVAFANRAMEKKKVLNATDWNNVHGEANNFVGMMNKAGDYPYTQGALGIPLQYSQFLHKMLESVTTNKIISNKTKAKLFTYYIAGFGVGHDNMVKGLDFLGLGEYTPDPNEDPVAYDLVVGGIVPYVFNTGMKLATGEKSQIDMRVMSAYDPAGLMDIFSNMVTMNLKDLYMESPTGSLFFGNNAKLTFAAKTWGRALGLVDDFEGNPTDFKTATQASLEAMSGFSAGYRAKMAMEYGKSYSSFGTVVSDIELSTPEMYAKALGFGTYPEAAAQFEREKIYNSEKEIRENAKKYIREMSKTMFMEGLTQDNIRSETMHLTAMSKYFRDNTRATEIFEQELNMWLSRNGESMVNRLIGLAGIIPPSEVRARIKAAHVPEEWKDAMLKELELVDKLKEDM